MRGKQPSIQIYIRSIGLDCKNTHPNKNVTNTKSFANAADNKNEMQWMWREAKTATATHFWYNIVTHALYLQRKCLNRFRRPLPRCLTSPIMCPFSRSLPVSVYVCTSFYVQAFQFRCLIVRRFLTPLFQSWHCIVDAACAPTWPQTRRRKSDGPSVFTCILAIYRTSHKQARRREREHFDALFLLLTANSLRA